MDEDILRYKDKLMEKAKAIPIWERGCLTVEEAAAYSNIGRKKLRSLLNMKECPFVLSDGKQLLVVREKLDEYISKHKKI